MSPASGLPLPRRRPGLLLAATLAFAALAAAPLCAQTWSIQPAPSPRPRPSGAWHAHRPSRARTRPRRQPAPRPAWL